MIDDNRQKYLFDDFTLENYRKIIQVAKNNHFQFSFFHDRYNDSAKSVLWRHDVEFSPFAALEMATIETEEGAKSTYFFQLHSECYNVIEKAVADIVFKIKLLGHDIGLHFDTHFFNVDNVIDLERYLALDVHYFNAIFNTEIKSFSFHNTNAFILNCEKTHYAGLINVYSKYFKRRFKYCADSTGYWRYERLIDVLNNPDIKKLHVLTHDAMWNAEVLPPRQRVFLSIDENSRRIKQWYDNTLKKFGAKNVDWNEVYE
ncbi:hypothetical protein EG832_08820 [bacterium]|nr:hypothetical protein [bacterium]